MIKSYDFKSPKKFTKERMSTVENLYDSFARALAPYLTGLLQSYCEIRINRIVEKRYQEFTNSVQDHSLFGMITLSPANKDYNEAPLTMEVDTRLAFFMIERLLGGAGTEYELTRDFTDIEKAVLQYVLGKLTEFAGEAWAQYLDIDATLTGLQTNPHLLQMSAQEDVVIQVELEVVIDKLAARLNMVMPAPNVEELTSKFGYSFAVSQKKQDDEKQKSKRQYIEQHLLESEVEIRAVLHEFSLDAQDILQLTPGDVIPLNKKLDSKISVYVEDVACFEAKVGHTRLRKAVEISSEL